ncbi:MAG: PDZ domain-containing protein [Phycisphaerales bacterium]|nr:MAG: PDZ domain-containing protein [Phycisphaerales bacterium]
MNMKKIICITTMALMLGGAASAKEERPYIGVRLDPTPLPDLLTKHLGLEVGQGIRIRNVNIGSPADTVGLERDDIIVRFQNENVNDLDRFVEAVRAAGIGEEVTLEIIHLGRRKTLKFALAPFEAGSQLKYPIEPDMVTTWRPGKVLTVAPDGQDWVEIHVDEMPNVDAEVKRFFNQLHTYHHSTEGEDYTISIEGDPKKEDSRITVYADDTEYSTTLGALDKLPEKYRGPAREAIEGAKKSSRTWIHINKRRLPQPPKPDVYRRYFQDLTIPHPNLEQWSEKKDQMLEKLDKQVERLQQRIEELEQQQRETLQKLLDKAREEAEDNAADDAAAAADEARPVV